MDLLLLGHGKSRFLAPKTGAPNDKDANPIEPICVLTFVIPVSTCPSRSAARNDNS